MAPTDPVHSSSGSKLSAISLGVATCTTLMILGFGTFVFHVSIGGYQVGLALLAGLFVGLLGYLGSQWLINRHEEQFRDQLNSLAQTLELPPHYDRPEQQAASIRENLLELMEYGRESMELLHHCSISLQRLEQLRQNNRDEWTSGQVLPSQMQQHRQNLLTSFDDIQQSLEQERGQSQVLCNSLQETHQEVHLSFQRSQLTLSNLSDLERSASEISGQTDSILKAVEQTGTSLDAVRSALETIHQNAESGTSTTERLQQETEQGLGLLRSAQEGMDQVRQQAERAGLALERLSEQSREIASITEVIRELVSDTELLAFNAAIIAAKAGEEGQAFSVIAEEIKELADRTTGSAKDIHQNLRQVGRETDEARDAVEATCHRIEQSQRQTQEAGQALHRINQCSQSVTQSHRSILQLTGDQSQQARSLLSETGLNLQWIRATVRALQTQRDAMEQTQQDITLLVSVLRQVDERLAGQNPLWQELLDQESQTRKQTHDFRHQLHQIQPLDQLETLIQHALERNTASQLELERIQRELDQNSPLFGNDRQQS